MYVKPYSDPSLYAPGGKCEPIAANFPCMKFWLKCTELSPSMATVADAISGAAPSTLSGVTGDGLKFTQADTSTITFTANLALPVISGTRAAVMFSVHNIVESSIFVQEFTGASFSKMSLATITSSVSDGTNASSLSTLTTAALKGVAMIYTPGTSNEGLLIEGDLSTVFPAGTPASAAPGDLTSLPSMTGCNFSTIIHGLANYGVAYMTFGAGIPANLRAGLNWMLAQWSDNIPALPVAVYGKLIYPGFKGLAG